jgi:hypothetical protein
LASLTVGVVFFSLWFWLLPQWLGFQVAAAEAANWRWLAAVPSVLGFAVALRCVWDYGWRGPNEAPTIGDNSDYVGERRVDARRGENSSRDKKCRTPLLDGVCRDARRDSGQANPGAVRENGGE